MTLVGGPGGGPAGRPKEPVLEARRVRLREVTGEDHAWLRWLVTTASVGYRYRYRGVTPSPEEFARDLWRNVLAQFVVERTSTGEPVGLMTSFNASFRDGHAQIGFAFDPAYQGKGWPLESFGLFFDYLFGVFDLRKLYGQLSEMNLDRMGRGLGTLFVEEARLRKHEFYDGRWWDTVILAVWRERWLAPGNRLRALFRAHEARADHN